MTLAVARELTPVPQSLLLDADWSMYSGLLRIFAEYPAVRLTYDRGRLEIVSPILKHDNVSRFLVLLIGALTDELDLPLVAGGGTTLRRRLRQKGAEPDECFWIANASRMEGRQRLDLGRDPPPDLAIEIDVTSSSLPRMPIFGALGVPEVWRWSKGKLSFHVRDSRGIYRTAARSRTFPLISPLDLLPFVQEAERSLNQTPLLRRFRKWVRQRSSDS